MKSNDIEELINIKNDLQELVKHKESILKLIDKREDIPSLKIDTDKLTGSIKSRSFKIDSAVLEEFLEFTKKYPELKQQDIVTQFFIDGLKKYNK